MKKFLTGLALLVASSLALAATEVRVHEQRTSEDGWQAFFAELIDQNLVDDNDTVEVSALLRDVCWRTEVRQYCFAESKFLVPSEQLVAGFQARNGFKNRVNLVEYRILAQTGGKGSFLPLPPAAAATTAATTATKPQTEAPAPVPAKVDPTIAKQLAEHKVFIEAQAKMMADMQGQLKEVVLKADSKSERQQIAALSGEVTRLQKEIEAQAKQTSGLTGTIMASGETITAARADLEKKIKAAVAEASAVIGRVSAVEQVVAKNTNSINSLWLAMAGGAVAILLLLYGVARKTIKNANAIKVVDARVDVAQEEFGHIKAEVELISTMVGKREVIFPDMFGMMVESVAQSPTEPSYVAKLEVQGAGAVMVTVTHAKPGYVHVSGVPGHDATLPVRLYKPKASKTYNGVQLLVFAVANRGGFDNLKLLKAA